MGLVRSLENNAQVVSLDPLKWARRLSIRTHQSDQEDSVAVLRNTKFREWLRLRGGGGGLPSYLGESYIKSSKQDLHQFWRN